MKQTQQQSLPKTKLKMERLDHLKIVLDWSSCHDDTMLGHHSVDTFSGLRGVLDLVALVEDNIILE